MPLQIIISRLSNFLFFIQKTDKNFDKFNLKKYFSHKNFDLFFCEENNEKIWKQIEKTLGKPKTRQLQENIILLESIFAPFWRKKYRQLLSWKRYFQNKKSLFQQVISDIKKLSGVRYFKVSKIPIYLVSDPLHNDKEIYAWFSWTPKKSFIVVEIPSNLNPPDNFFPIGVLAHEFFHLVLRKNKSLFLEIGKIAEDNKKLFKKLSQKIPPRLFLEELLISSFIPEGYLSKKHFNAKITSSTTKPKGLLAWRKVIAFKLKQLAKLYIDNLWNIDDEYLKGLIKNIKNIKRPIKSSISMGPGQ